MAKTERSSYAITLVMTKENSQRKIDTTRKKEMHDNFDDNKKRELKKVDNKRKKEKRDNLYTHGKELLKKYLKKRKEKIA